MTKAADPTGRLDIFAIGLVERLVDTRLPLPVRMVFRRYKPQIDRSIRRCIGKVRLSDQELAAIRQAVFNAAAARAQVGGGQGGSR